jgi:hypothetical protein
MKGRVQSARLWVDLLQHREPECVCIGSDPIVLSNQLGTLNNTDKAA